MTQKLFVTVDHGTWHEEKKYDYAPGTPEYQVLCELLVNLVMSRRDLTVSWSIIEVSDEPVNRIDERVLPKLG